MAQGPVVNLQATNGRFMQSLPITGSTTTGLLNHAPAAATAAVCTLDADTDRPNRLNSVFWSYSAAPTGGSIKVEAASGSTIWGPHAITAAWPGSWTFDPPLETSKNQALIVTLASGGGSVVGALSIGAFRQY